MYGTELEKDRSIPYQSLFVTFVSKIRIYQNNLYWFSGLIASWLTSLSLDLTFCFVTYYHICFYPRKIIEDSFYMSVCLSFCFLDYFNAPKKSICNPNNFWTVMVSNIRLQDLPSQLDTLLIITFPVRCSVMYLFL